MEGQSALTRFQKIALVILVAAIGGYIHNYYSRLYSAEPISGLVVDSETGMPISGAVVYVQWYSLTPDIMNSSRRIFEIQEVVTDSQGKYLIPGWNKVKRLAPYGSYIGGETPEVLVFKYGYKVAKRQNFFRDHNTREVMIQHNSIIRWYVSTEFKIEKLSDDFGKRKEYYAGMLGYGIGEGCDLKKSLKYLMEIDKYYEDWEKYVFERFQNNVPGVTADQYRPWYLAIGSPPRPLDCPEIIKILSNERKLRGNSNR